MCLGEPDDPAELIRHGGADPQVVGRIWDHYHNRLCLDRRLPGRTDPSNVLQEAFVDFQARTEENPRFGERLRTHSPFLCPPAAPRRTAGRKSRRSSRGPRAGAAGGAKAGASPEDRRGIAAPALSCLKPRRAACGVLQPILVRSIKTTEGGKTIMADATKKLAGKVALVTGGSRGIGAAVARRLASEGAAVAVTYNASPGKADEVVRGIRDGGGKAIAIKAESADAGAVTAAVDRAAAELGGLDILVNNAGVLPLGSIADFKLEDFDRTVAINVRAVFVASKAAVRHMRDGGRIINIGSTNAERMPFPG